MRLVPKFKANYRATVLLEVLVALALFVSAAAIITAALNASINSVERLRLNTHAANLAISVLSELQMGIKTLALEGPQEFEAPFGGWTWEALTTSADSGSTGAARFQKIEVTIRHDEPPLVYRLSQVIRIGDTLPADRAGAGLGRRAVAQTFSPSF